MLVSGETTGNNDPLLQNIVFGQPINRVMLLFTPKLSFPEVPTKCRGTIAHSTATATADTEQESGSETAELMPGKAAKQATHTIEQYKEKKRTVIISGR